LLEEKQITGWRF